MILIVTSHHNVKMCATIERGVFVGTNNGQNLLNLWVCHTHAHPLLEITNFFMQQVVCMTNWTSVECQLSMAIIYRQRMC